jgi:hypothetical protein
VPKPSNLDRCPRPVVGAVLVWLIAAPASADPAEEPPVVVLLSPTESERDSSTLKAAVSAQLSDFDVDVRIGESDPLPASAADQADIARRTASEQEALAVVWIGADADQIQVFVDDGEDGTVLQRPIPSEGDDWEELSDAIASMVRSMLVPWLDEPEPAGETPDAESTAEEASDTVDPAAESLDTPSHQLLVLLGARVGYEPVVMSQEDRYLNGAYVGLGLCLGRYLGFDAGLALLQVARVRIDGEDIRLTRWPVRIAASGRLPIRRAVLGLRLAFVVNATRVHGIPSEETTDDTDLDYLGLGPSIFVGFGATEWLELGIDGGVDFYFDSNDYVYRDQVMFTFAPVQPRFFAGAVFYFFGG